jgi:hypothetical protein
MFEQLICEERDQMTDSHLSELMRQCADATPLKRLNVTEQSEVFAWLLDGHMSRTGEPLQRPRQQPAPVAYTGDGQPIFKAGADFSTHETVSMPASKQASKP